MNSIVNRHTAKGRNPLTRIRYQLGGALLLAVVLPYLVRVTLFEAPVTPGFHNTLIAAIFAILMGEYFLRSIAAYPGVKAIGYAAPVFLATFGVVVGVMVMARVEYNRINLFAALMLCIAWYLYALAMSARRRQLSIGYVPYGNVQELIGVEGVAWRRLDSVDAPFEGLDGLVADLRYDLPDEWERRLADATLSGIMVYHSKQLREALTGKVRIDHLSENNFGSLMPVAAYLRIKVVVDFLAAVVALPFVAAIIGMVWIAMRGDRSQPFIFRQQRVGYRGKPFTMYKIRTMFSETQRGGDHGGDHGARTLAMTAADDPRITPLGRRLRKWRIDELPQIVNILRGEMSWIGPRPEALALSHWYLGELPFYSYRHVVRPGLTGWAQVNQGHVAHVDEVREKLENDFYYIKYFSPWLDTLIVVRTIRTIFTGFGAR